MFSYLYCEFRLGRASSHSRHRSNKFLKNKMVDRKIHDIGASARSGQRAGKEKQIIVFSSTNHFVFKEFVAPMTAVAGSSTKAELTIKV